MIRRFEAVHNLGHFLTCSRLPVPTLNHLVPPSKRSKSKLNKRVLPRLLLTFWFDCYAYEPQGYIKASKHLEFSTHTWGSLPLDSERLMFIPANALSQVFGSDCGKVCLL